MIYINDCIVYISGSFEKHVVYRDAGLKLKVS